MASPLHHDWPERGLCRTHPEPEIWFPRRNTSPEATRARKVCTGCPVQSDCLREALALDDTWGIWAATDEEQRAAMRHRRGARVA